jgi:type VI secretion system secreted protein Hcp
MAVTNVYLKLGDLKGESVDTGHEDWIEVESFSWGVDNPSSFAVGQGGQATQAHISALNISKACDASSVFLWQAATSGKHIPNATMSCLKLDTDTQRLEYLKVELTNLMVSSVQWSGAGGDTQVREHVSLVFAEFTSTYNLQTDTGAGKGAVHFGWNIQTSKAK